MTPLVRVSVVALALVAVLGVMPQAAQAQARAGAPAAAARQGRAGGAASVAEAERLFDRYMLGQARMALQLTPDQLMRFGQRFEQLQMLQRQRQRQRQRRLLELQALTRRGPGADEAAVANLLRTIDAETAEADKRVRTARERLDEVLSVRQRARYRAFEVRMEREKLRLISRARAEARGADAPDWDAAGDEVAPGPVDPR